MVILRCTGTRRSIGQSDNGQREERLFVIVITAREAYYFYTQYDARIGRPGIYYGKERERGHFACRRSKVRDGW